MKRKIWIVLTAMMILAAALVPASVSAAKRLDIIGGISGVWQDGSSWFAFTGSTLTFTAESLADQADELMDAFMEGTEFTYKMANTDKSTSKTLTANSSGVYAFEVPEAEVRDRFRLELYDNGVSVYNSDTFRARADVTTPSAPTNLRWNGTVAMWNPSSGGDVYEYFVNLYREDGTSLTGYRITKENGNIATSYDFNESLRAFGRGKYYFTVTAWDINDLCDGMAQSSLYQYTGPVNSYTASFDPGEGSGTMNSITAEAGELAALPACTFTAPAGKTFKAWENRGNEYAAGYRTTLASNETYTAVWTSDPSEVLVYGVEMDDVAFSLKANYNFNGQTAQAVTVRNTGTVKLEDVKVTLTGTDASAFVFTYGYKYFINPGTTCNDAWFIRAAANLDPGTYTATLTFTANGIAPVTAALTLTVMEHDIDPNVWESNSTHHWNPCSECAAHVNEAPHNNNTLMNYAAPTFNKDGYSGDRLCSVCGREVETGHPLPAGKYIRQSAASMTPAQITNGICANDLVFTSGDPELYTVEFTRIYDLTDETLNTSSGQYPHNALFAGGHTYLIEFRFTAVSPYVYDEQHSDYSSTFTLNGAETQTSNATVFSGSTLRKVHMTAADTTEDTWKISFNSGGGRGAMAMTSVVKGEQYTLPECEFTASAYNEEFDRWDKGAPGTKINITGDTVITALWKYKVWKITFNANGGTGTMAPETVVVGNDYTLPECTFTPPANKVFEGWNKGQPGQKITVTADMEITALWKDLVWNISFDANSGTGSMPADTVARGQKYTLPDCTFNAPANKTFDRWDKGMPGDRVDITQDTVIKALWKDLTWTITFDAGGGTGAMAATEVVRGQQYTLPECSFMPPTDKVFDQWDKGSPGERIVVTGDTVITAQWKDRPPASETWMITFDAGGGSGMMAPVYVNKGEKYTLPACRFTAPEGKAFDRWDKGMPGDRVDITQDTVIKALWKDLTWTITFSAGGGSGTMAPVYVNRGEKYTLPACKFTAPAGKEFDRWDLGAPGTRIDIPADTLITARWKDKAVVVDTVTVSGGVYKLNHKKLTAVFTKPKDKNAKSLKIPDTVKANGKTYKVTEIKSGACKGMKKLATLTIGKNVAKIGSKAFSDCTKLKKITIKCASMAKGGFGSKCFSKINEKAVFKVPKKMLKKYEEWIIKKGKAPKGCKIKK